MEADSISGEMNSKPIPNEISMMEKSKMTYWFERGKVEADTFGEISPQNPRFHKRTEYKRERRVEIID